MYGEFTIKIKSSHVLILIKLKSLQFKLVERHVFFQLVKKIPVYVHFVDYRLGSTKVRLAGWGFDAFLLTVSCRGLCVGPITQLYSPTENGVSECDLENSTMRRPWPTIDVKPLKK